jgi:WhiB family redox-sensing transcriptional regulator
MITLISEPWVQQALCAQLAVHPDLFYVSKRTRPEDVDAALAVCGACTVRRDCLNNALDYNDPWGIWGGTTESQRASGQDEVG